MIQVLFFLHLFLQPQSVAAQAADSAKVLLQSGIDAENRNDLDRALIEFRKAHPNLHLAHGTPNQEPGQHSEQPPYCTNELHLLPDKDAYATLDQALVVHRS